MQRNFKHKQTGKIATQLQGGHYNISNTLGLISKEFVENTNDWEEIIELNYRILSFKNLENGNIYKLNPNGTYGYGLWHYSLQQPCYPLQIPLEQCLGRYKIHSVCRLRDGSIFSVNDWVKHIHTGKVFKITNFQLWITDHLRVGSTPGTGTFDLDAISIASEPKKKLTIKLYEDSKLKKTVVLEKGEQLLIQYTD